MNTIDGKGEVKSSQGVHSGTIKKYFRLNYSCELVTHIKRNREIEGWYDTYYVPIPYDDLTHYIQKKVIEEIFDEEGGSVGVHICVRNYHYKEREKKKDLTEIKIRDAINYEKQKERSRKYAKLRYEQNKGDPEFREKRRKYQREYQRRIHGYQPSEVAQRNQIRREMEEGIRMQTSNDDNREARIAFLMQMDEQGLLNQDEITELETLLKEEI